MKRADRIALRVVTAANVAITVGVGIWIERTLGLWAVPLVYASCYSAARQMWDDMTEILAGRWP
jgi:hypothetical protein